MPTPSFTLKSMTLRAFRSVVEEQTIPLPSTGMHMLVGHSGAGKTTVAEGIAFALGYSNYSATDLQSWEWLTGEALRDTLELGTPKGDLRVTRGKQASIAVPGEEKVRTSAKAVKEGLRQTLGLDPELYLAPLTYRSQKTSGLFLSMADSEKKSFLTNLLGVGHLEPVVEVSVKRSSSLAEEVERAKVRHQALLSAVPPEPPAPKLVDEVELRCRAEEVELEVDKLKAAVEEAKGVEVEISTRAARRAEEVKDSWSPRLVQAKAAIDSTTAPDTQPLRQQLGELQSLERAIVGEHTAAVSKAHDEYVAALRRHDDAANVAQGRSTIARELQRVEDNHSQLQAIGVCYTCRREWQEDDLRLAEVARCEAAMQKLRSDLVLLAEVESKLPQLRQSMTSAQAALTELRGRDPVSAELKEQQTRLSGLIAASSADHRARVEGLRAEYQRLAREAEREVAAASAMTKDEEQARAVVSQLHDALRAVESRSSQARQAEAFARRENESATRHREQMVAQRGVAQKAADAAADAVQVAEGALAEEKDFLGMVRGFLAYIFDETLARIADKTNARLALIPNVADVTVRFASERETGTGKLRQEITAVCEKGGRTIPLRAGVSGGMLTAIELAVDLSLADVISERTGVYPGWLILDEAFEGLDTACKSACFELLKDVSKDRAVLVVDHTQEFSELFDSRIVVEYDGKKSTVKVAS